MSAIYCKAKLQSTRLSQRTAVFSSAVCYSEIYLPNIDFGMGKEAFKELAPIRLRQNLDEEKLSWMKAFCGGGDEEVLTITCESWHHRRGHPERWTETAGGGPSLGRV